MAIEEKQLYLRGRSRPKIEPYLNMLETVPATDNRLERVRVAATADPELSWL